MSDAEIDRDSNPPGQTAETAVDEDVGSLPDVPTEADPTPKPHSSAPAEDQSTAEEGGDGDSGDVASLWLRRGDRIVVGVLAAAAVALSAVHWAWLSGWGLEPIEIEHLPARRYDSRLEVNSAPWTEWMQLEGIGETLARRIVAYRRQHGPFERIDELDRVEGIGPKTLERLRPHLRLERTPEEPADRGGR